MLLISIFCYSKSKNEKWATISSQLLKSDSIYLKFNISNGAKIYAKGVDKYFSPAIFENINDGDELRFSGTEKLQHLLLIGD